MPRLVDMQINIESEMKDHTFRLRPSHRTRGDSARKEERRTQSPSNRTPGMSKLVLNTFSGKSLIA